MSSSLPDRTDGFFPKRMIHLDFHTGPSVPDVGTDFDPDQFADTFARANVDSVTVFAKCHHGHLYYDTDRPERHPNLPRDLHLLEMQVAALHSRGIRAPIYVSAQCDEYAANTHPEWIAMDGKEQVKWGEAYAGGWQILDMSSPYQDYLAEQLQEVFDRFAPLDGLFLDMCWDQPSSSVWARAGAKAQGLDPADPHDRATYARRVVHAYMDRFSAMAEPYFNKDVASGIWFNSRPKTTLSEERRYLHHIEIESLPTGGWGYTNFPYLARYVRPLGLPTLSHTGRFFRSWGDNGGLKPAAALRFETVRILSQGLTSGVGDLLSPTGRVNPVTYDLVGDAYGHLKACEPFLTGTRVAVEAALVVDTELGDDPGAPGIGAMRALMRSHVQFDIVGVDAALDDYRLVVVPESTPLDETLVRRLLAHADAGGGVLVSRQFDEARDDTAALAMLGIKVVGPLGCQHEFLRPDASLGAAAYDHVIYQRGIAVEAPSYEPLCAIVDPYFPRAWDHFSGHSYTAASGVVSPYPAIVARGDVVVCAVPLLAAHGADAAPFFGDLTQGLIDRLLPRPLVSAGGPKHLETTLATGPDSLVLHVVSFLPTRATEGHDPAAAELDAGPIDLVEDPFPIIDVPIAVRVDDRRVTSVKTQPDGHELTWTEADGYVHTKVTCLDGHTMVVIEVE